jgi:hypothetical protein
VTEKDYNRFAKAIKWAHSGLVWNGRNYVTIPKQKQESIGFRAAVDSIVEVLQVDNGNFDKGRFYAACGLEMD